MKKISCIIPVYNVQDFIIECLDSVYNQNYPNKELIIVNDGSTDNSHTLISKWIKDKENIIFIDKPNGGLSDARNYGLDCATGEYISFIDSDDVLLDKDIFSRAINIIENNSDCDIVQYNMILKWASRYSQLTRYEYGTYKTLEEKAIAYSKMTIHGSCCDKVFKSSVFESLRFPKGVISEDIFIIPEIIRISKTIIVSDFGNYGYRFRPGSISKSILPYEKYVSCIQSYCRYWNFLEQFNICHKYFYSTYVDFIWCRTATLNKSYSKHDLKDFYSSSIFIKKSLLGWIKELKNIYGLKKRIKSFIVFFIGPKYIHLIQR